MLRGRLVGIVTLAALAVGAGCATGQDLQGTSSNFDAGDGAIGTAAATGAGGVSTSSGGATDSGGSPGTAGGGGQSAGSGGAPSNGGAIGSGGEPSGTGGAASSGGAPGSGGNASSGGMPGTGGAPGCAPGLKQCGANCVTVNPANGCDGTSCTTCPAPANGTALCVSGQCDFTCFTGYVKGTTSCQPPPSCTDKAKNGAETDVDCGGGTCPQCPTGLKCGKDSDCSRGPCQSGVCGCTAKTCAAAASCATSVDNTCGKTIDCSGSCTGATVCYQNLCCTPATACPAKSCSTTVQNGCGGNIDCSGNCTSPDVCMSSQCCTPRACGTMCGHPSDNCGNVLNCGLCADGVACQGNADCTSGACESGKCVSCTDGKKNHGETDTDCGGPNCGKCANGKKCSAASDCQSNNCCPGFSLGACFLHSNVCE
jgi:hypothetical protein